MEAKIKVVDQRMIEDPIVAQAALIVSQIDVVGGLKDKGAIFLGVDPGPINMGLAVIVGNKAQAWEVTLSRSNGREIQMNLVYIVTRRVLGHTSLAGRQRLYIGRTVATVEGAAYMMRAGQVYLAEARAASTIAIQQEFAAPDVKITPPKSIRKAVFGDGRIRAEDVWEGYIPPNAAAALAAALHAHQRTP